MYADDTIVAIATPPGPGGVGIIRISGSKAVEIARRVFRFRRPRSPRSHRLYRGFVIDGVGDVVDEVLAVFMFAPHSYTGEDVVELHGHASPMLLRRVLQLCCAAGARPAEPGEFTKRAFLNGRLDLVQAEAVAELVAGRTEEAARIGVRHLSGTLSAALASVRARLVEVKARIEALIDFAEEEIDVDVGSVRQLLEDTRNEMARLLGSYRHGRLLREGLHLVILGRPNVGKSSLLNALLGSERAIVTAIAGTTRDVIEEGMDLAGVPVVLSDTAGLRPEPEEIERIGIERARAKADRADGAIVVLDRSRPLTPDDAHVLDVIRDLPCIVVLNKCDLAAAWTATMLPERPHVRVALEISAKTGAGLPELREGIRACFEPLGTDTNAPVLTLARHSDLLTRAHDAVQLAVRGLDSGTAVDVVAVDVQSAMEHIGAITGEITTEEVLDRIFRDFCIGK